MQTIEAMIKTTPVVHISLLIYVTIGPLSGVAMMDLIAGVG